MWASVENEMRTERPSFVLLVKLLFFLGASKVALTLDVNTRRRVIHVRCDSDVFAQEFSRRVRTIQTVTIRFKLFKLGSKVFKGLLVGNLCLKCFKSRSNTCSFVFFVSEPEQIESLFHNLT